MALEVVARGQKYSTQRDPAWAAGRHVTTLSLHDQHFYSAGWVAVQEAMYADGLEGFAAKADQMRHVLRVGDDGSRRWHPDRADLSKYVSFGRPQYWTGAAWADLPLSGGVRSGNLITWDRANFTLRVLITWRKVLFSLTLKSAAAARRFRFPVSLNNLGWDNWKLTSGGLTVARVSAETAVDANGVELPVARSYSGGYVEYSADLTGAAYPVTLTPLNDTTILGDDAGEADKDTYIKASQATTNFGTSDRLRIDVAANHVALIDISLAALTPGDTCDSATWTSYRVDTVGSSDQTLTFYQLLQASWTEAGATWNTYDGSNAWNTAGAAGVGTDYDSTSLGTATIPGTSGGAGIGSPTTGGLLTAATVQGLFGGTLRLKVICSGERYQCSSDHATAGYRPTVTVVWTAAGGPSVVASRRSLLGVGV